MFVTNWISPTKIQKISEITNFFRHYFLSRTEVIFSRSLNVMIPTNSLRIICVPLYWRKSLEVAITQIQSPRLMINCNFATHGRVVMHGTAHLIADAKATLHN